MTGPRSSPHNGATPLRQDDLDAAGLMVHIQRGDAEAFDRLLSLYWRGAHSYAEHLLGDRESAHDVVQEAFIRLWQRRAVWKPSGPVRVWIFRTVRNLCISEHRRAMVRARWAAAQADLETSAGRTPLRDVEDAELARAMDQAIKHLSPRRREVFTLFHIEELSYREISDILAIRPQTVANYLQAALADLRIALRAFFPALSGPRSEGQAMRSDGRGRSREG